MYFFGGGRCVALLVSCAVYLGWKIPTTMNVFLVCRWPISGFAFCSDNDNLSHDSSILNQGLGFRVDVGLSDVSQFFGCCLGYKSLYGIPPPTSHFCAFPGAPYSTEVLLLIPVRVCSGQNYICRSVRELAQQVRSGFNFLKLAFFLAHTCCANSGLLCNLSDPTAVRSSD